MTEPPEPPVQPEQPGEFSDFFHTDELPTGPVERHSHRGSPANGPLGRRVLAPLTAVVVVVVVILLLIWINGKPAGNGPGPGVISAPTGSTTPQVTIPPSNRPKHSTSSAPHTTPTTQPTSTPTARVSSTPTAPGSISTITSAARHAMAPVDVLNNSTISGLAAHVAAEVKAKGWAVPSVGNLQGAIPVTTVFYPAGDLAAAKHLKREFASIAQVAPNASAHLTTKHLTLVVTRNWSG